MNDNWGMQKPFCTPKNCDGSFKVPHSAKSYTKVDGIPTRIKSAHSYTTHHLGTQNCFTPNSTFTASLVHLSEDYP